VISLNLQDMLSSAANVDDTSLSTYLTSSHIRATYSVQIDLFTVTR
jgi:hypothetical protein